jgi:hypothetical protein
MQIDTNWNYKVIDVVKDILFRCKFYLHPSLYENIMNFLRYADEREKILNFRSEYNVDYLSTIIISNKKGRTTKL